MNYGLPTKLCQLDMLVGLYSEDMNDSQSDREEFTKSRPYGKNNHTTHH